MITKLEARKIVFEKRKNIKDFKDFNGCFVDNFYKIEELINIKNKIIAGYYPFDFECNVLEILKYYSKNNKICLPVIKNKIDIMNFFEWDFKGLKKNSIFKKYNIMEPISDKKLIPEIVIVPAVAVDIYGNRVGYGSGYYDKTLKNIKCVKIGTIFNFQLFDYELENNNNDVRLDYILTENSFIKI